jgi:hypothetical protein
MSAPLVSVIVLNFNRRDEIRDALRSISAQDYGPMETIVLDNGSTDGSVAMLRSEFPSVKLIESVSNLGACAGRNRALESASGDLVFQMDNDAILSPVNAVSMMVDRFAKEDDLGIVFARIEDADTGRAYRPGYGSAYVEDEFYTWRFHGCAAMIRRDAIRKAGYYLPEEFFRAAEENDLAVRVLDAGYNILYMPAATARHKLSPRARDTGEIVFLTVRNNLRVAWKFYPVMRAMLLTLWRPAHYLVTRLAAGDFSAVPGFFRILAGQFDAIARRRPIKPDTMRLIDALAVAPAMTLEEMRAMRQNPPSLGLPFLIRKRLGGGS